MNSLKRFCLNFHPPWEGYIKKFHFLVHTFSSITSAFEVRIPNPKSVSIVSILAQIPPPLICWYNTWTLLSHSIWIILTTNTVQVGLGYIESIYNNAKWGSEKVLKSKSRGTWFFNHLNGWYYNPISKYQQWERQSTSWGRAEPSSDKLKLAVVWHRPQSV